jgi:hypothetical protein
MKRDTMENLGLSKDMRSDAERERDIEALRRAMLAEDASDLPVGGCCGHWATFDNDDGEFSA